MILLFYQLHLRKMYPGDPSPHNLAMRQGKIGILDVGDHLPEEEQRPKTTLNRLTFKKIWGFMEYYGLPAIRISHFRDVWKYGKSFDTIVDDVWRPDFQRLAVKYDNGTLPEYNPYVTKKFSPSGLEHEVKLPAQPIPPSSAGAPPSGFDSKGTLPDSKPDSQVKTEVKEEPKTVAKAASSSGSVPPKTNKGEPRVGSPHKKKRGR